ncbi:hypothetical protein LIER_36918 [Lithospermum erythrorhizon]|uniref:ATP-dependent DNA helicase n=1 Tax=Lithospermum erythrorhizon TaxID=34254 RepID=A0AAV3PFB1_LITER
MRLDFLKSNQKKLRREYYQGVVDSVVSGLPTKGHDKVMFRIASDSTETFVDEISDFQDAHWSLRWKLLGEYLAFHLPNFQTLHFEDDADLEEILQDERGKRTMLTEFFRINSMEEEASDFNFLYKEFPKHYIWDGQIKTWTRRKRGTVIGRLSVVNPVKNERYYLRIPLNNVRFPTSYNFLLLVDRTMCETFQEAAHKRGLLQNDGDIETTMEEASVYKMPSELWRLFATLLNYYILHKVLCSINETLESLRKDVNEYHLDREELFFIDGPGGTGKSYLYKVLLAHVRSKEYVALIVASSGIASSCFLGGRTAHSRFKIPIDTGPRIKCHISFQSSEADLIRSSKIIIRDEAPMVDKSAIKALDKLLQDCMRTLNHLERI